MNELETIELYTKYLRERGVSFTDSGFPIFKEKWFTTEKPKAIITFDKRNKISLKRKEISICFFEDDERLYPRFDKVFEEIPMLKNYHSVCMMDISISPLMDVRLQNTNLLLNMLYICILAVNGIKILPSIRTGEIETINILNDSICNAPYWVMGALGTQKKMQESQYYFEYLFRTKCLKIRPKHILIYGKPSKSTENILLEYNIDYTVYVDFRTQSYAGGFKI